MKRVLDAFAHALPCLALAVCCVVGTARAQDDRPDAAIVDIEKVFGASSEAGFRVSFTRYGALVKHVNLIDHAPNSLHAEGRDGEYLLSDILWVNPAFPSAGFFAWLGLEEWPIDGQRVSEVDAGTALWDFADLGPDAVQFTLDLGGGLSLEKVFRHERGRRDLMIEIAMRSATGAERHPLAGQSNGWRLRGLAVRSPRSEYTRGQNRAYAVGESVNASGEVTYHRLQGTGAPNVAPLPTIAEASGPGSRIVFAGSTNRFFGAFLYPEALPGIEGLWIAQCRLMPDVEQADTPVRTLPVVEYGLRLAVPEPGAESRLKYRLYMGPKSKRVFAAFPEYEQFGHVVDHDLEQTGCFCSIPGSQTMAKVLLWLLGKIYDFVGNWGLAIMVLTILVRGALVPLNFRMQKSMRAYGEKAARLKPKLEAIQKQYANDRKQLQQAMVTFQRENKLFPPIGGCLPMFVTIPVFLGLFTALRTSYDLRQQPFMLWVDDLSQPDALFELGFAWFPHFNLLPILMVALWWWLQSSTPLPTDPQQRQMMKIMRFMPLMFGVMLYSYASGLMVYMITSSLFALVEQRIVKRILGPMNAEAGAFATPTI